MKTKDYKLLVMLALPAFLLFGCKSKIYKYYDSIEIMSKWYIDNIYTYQGAHKTKKELLDAYEKNVSEYESQKSYEKLLNKTSTFNECDIVMEPVNCVKTPDGKWKNHCARYSCDILKLKGEDEKIYVADDCSKYVAATYAYFFQLIDFNVDDFRTKICDINTNSFISTQSEIVKTLLNSGYFEYIDYSCIKQMLVSGQFEFQKGDMIYSKNKDTDNDSAHVEFYIENGKVFGWGKIQQVYPASKNISFDKTNIYCDKNKICYAIIRFKQK